MIYIDVTSAASSAMNTGVQRSIRGTYELLSSQGEVTPLRWDFSARRYARLSPRETKLLTQPFAFSPQSTGRPGYWDWLTSRGVFQDKWTRRKRGLPLVTLLKPDDVFFIPDLCWDKRIETWPELAGLPGRKVAIFHDAMPLRIPGQTDSKDQLFARYVRELARLDGVICVSREVEQDLQYYWKAFGVTPRPTFVLPWPVPFFGERPHNPPNPASRSLIYVSRLRLRKNHLVLLEACERLWQEGLQFSLDLIGIADAFVDTWMVLRRVRHLFRRGRAVRWRRHVNEKELTQAYQNCSFTVFPSRMEGFGLPILESLWHRRPVICGSNGAIGEVAGGGGCLQVDQNSAEELSGAIRHLLTDTAGYDRLYAEAGARTFRSWTDYGRDLAKVLSANG